MSRHTDLANRCPRCRLHESLCVCALLPRLETRTRVVLFLHRDEDRKSTNTGRLAAACLPNSEVRVRGHREAPSEPFVCDDGSLPLLLFPHEDAAPLAELAGGGRPVTLLVPDGTWRQAFKVRKRVPGLDRVACAALPAGPLSSYRLRAEPRDGALSTLEAIARALGVLEGHGVEQALERVFRIMVERSLWARGAIDRSEVTGGIPEGVKRHDPHSGAPGGAARRA